MEQKREHTVVVGGMDQPALFSWPNVRRRRRRASRAIARCEGGCLPRIESGNHYLAERCQICIFTGKDWISTYDHRSVRTGHPAMHPACRYLDTCGLADLSQLLTKPCLLTQGCFHDGIKLFSLSNAGFA